MGKIAIKVENLSKAYQLGEIGTGTISRDLERWFARVRGKEDPFLRIGETNDRTSKGSSGIVWSLKDINFEIEQGDAVGIIGRNGAGKSTLLKVLSRVTSPTRGKISGKGRIASLLEVGTGFHPDLTGRENIFLNGAILGMRKREIQRKFDEIVDFAGVERYVDTPVKRYSSGMYVRLAFAVAAHLESEILIVDEVLAVGDAEFQKKCLGKMGEVSKGEGRTVLFVSHNMGSVMRLCNKGLLLHNGNILNTGNSRDMIFQYQNLEKDATRGAKRLDSNYSVLRVNHLPDNIHSLQDCTFSLALKSKERRMIKSIVPLIYNQFSQRVAILDLRGQIGSELKINSNESVHIEMSLTAIPFIEGEYSLGLYIDDEIGSKDYFDLYRFSLLPAPNADDEIAGEYDPSVRGIINLNFKMNLNVQRY